VFVAGLLAGSVVGGCVVWILAESRRPPVVADDSVRASSTSYGATEWDAIRRGLDDLTVRIDRLTVVLEGATATPFPIEADRTPENAMPLPSASKRADDSSWTKVLDHDVARRLVERGVTPFDPGISALVAPTCAALRESDAGLENELKRLRGELGVTGSYQSGDEYDRRSRGLFDGWKLHREKLLLELDRSIDALQKDEPHTK
jgi:hypothetical protein